MTIRKHQLKKTSKHLADLVTSISQNKTGYIPRKINVKETHQSPVFQNPQKWISKFKFLDESQRIQSYKPLEFSVIAHILASPPRMTHGTRTVVPRDLLIPLRIMENPIEDDDDFKHNEKNEKNDKNSNFKYIIAPFHPREKKLPEDPVTYYPRKLSLFNVYDESSTSTEKTIGLKKFTINPTMYPNIVRWNSVGWNIDTAKVIEKISADQLIEYLQNLGPLYSPELTDIPGIKLHTGNTNNIWVEDQVLNIALDKIKETNPAFVNLLLSKFPGYYIPINDTTKTIVNELIKYTVLIDS